MTKLLFGAAREQLLADVQSLYSIGCTIREISAQTGYSYGATRAQLKAAGVVLRPKHGGRPAWDRTAGDPLSVRCPKCSRSPGSKCLQPSLRVTVPHLARVKASVAQR